MAKHLITLVGPTAIGKTDVSIALAKRFKAPIISCDSRQFYKEMSVGTAVPTTAELNEAKHYFIQDRSIEAPLNVGSFEKLALELLSDLFQKHDQVIMVGGSGLYMNAVLEGLDYFPEIDPAIRKSLIDSFEKEGIEVLQKRLQSLDPISCKTIDIQNPHRLIRALEVCIGSGKPFAAFKNQPKQKRNFIPIKIGLNAQRELLYDRINKRVDIMMSRGLLEEVRRLLSHQDLAALQTVGYQELFKYFEGELSLEKAVEEIKKNTRRFAKRQITWNKKIQNITWFEFPFDIGSISSYIAKVISRAV
jgi:tRNA dimethylallyltransferase